MASKTLLGSWTDFSWTIRPISEASLQPGEKSGPYLVSPGINGRDWIVGFFDGEEWYNLAGEIKLDPRYFAPLPSADELGAALGPSAS